MLSSVEVKSEKYKQGLNFSFYSMGFTSISAITNLQSCLVYLLVMAILYFSYALIASLSVCRPSLNKAKEAISKRLLWRWTMRFTYQLFQPFLLCSFINFSDVSPSLPKAPLDVSRSTSCISDSRSLCRMLGFAYCHGLIYQKTW
jgi:hypothetical protein